MREDPHDRIVCSIHNTGKRDSLKHRGFCVDCLYTFSRMSGDEKHDITAMADYLAQQGKTQENLEMAVKGQK